jgi:hypothetical protein
MVRLPPGYRKLLDEFGTLEAKIAKLQEYASRREKLRKQILEWVESLPPKQGIDLQGGQFCVAISPRRPERVIQSMPKVFKALGKKQFVELASISAKELEKHLNAEAYARLVKKEPIGWRTVTATARAKVAHAA